MKIYQLLILCAIVNYATATVRIIADGGTNSGTALVNGKVMCSSGGKIIECGSAVSTSLDFTASTATLSGSLSLPTSGGTATGLNYYQTGSYTATGYGISSTGTYIKATRIGRYVTLTFVAVTFTTSTAGTYGLDLYHNLPTVFRPTGNTQWTVPVSDGSSKWGILTWDATATTWTLTSNAGNFGVGSGRGFDRDISISFMKY